MPRKAFCGTTVASISLMYRLEDRFMVDDEHQEASVEAALVNQTSDPTGWLETIYREHARTVLQTAYRVTGSAADAEDVLQTVFTRLASRPESPDFTTGSSAYLRRAATNAALDIVQSRFVRSGVSLEVSGDSVHRDNSPAPDRQHLGRELRDLLRRSLATLSRRSAEIFALRYFEGLDNEEIARQLGTTPGTVAVTLHRARARLKTEMAPYMGGLQ
jgi:RNA polymerase sigma-70 factor (ECF subfamily)